MTRDVSSFSEQALQRVLVLRIPGGVMLPSGKSVMLLIAAPHQSRGLLILVQTVTLSRLSAGLDHFLDPNMLNVKCRDSFESTIFASITLQVKKIATAASTFRSSAIEKTTFCV